MISIHALLAESDQHQASLQRNQHQFLSTLSLRRATNIHNFDERVLQFLSTLSLRRATQGKVCKALANRFLSTLSLRRATCSIAFIKDFYGISIHALLAESDAADRAYYLGAGHFYPRSPCGERHDSPIYVRKIYNFYPRSPCGERRANSDRKSHRIYISIHALLAESDCDADAVDLFPSDFYPRSPCGERPQESAGTAPGHTFLSTLSLRRATQLHYNTQPDGHFYPRSPCGERPGKTQKAAPRTVFLSTLSLRRATRPP